MGSAMKYPKIISSCILILILTISSYSKEKYQKKTSTIKGQVIEAHSGKPIIGANVLLAGTMIGAATNSHGEFKISQVPYGKYNMIITVIGYKKAEKIITVSPEEFSEIIIPLRETVLFVDGIAVTASRYKQSVKEIPVSLSLVSSQEIAERNIISVDQALRYVPGVNALDGGQITIRGSSGFNWGVGSRVLVLLNGHSFMCGDLRNVNWFAIPTAKIDQIEVMKGSGSALYGSSAMGGVINIITKDSEDGNHINLRSYTGFYDNPSYSQWQWTKKQNHFEGTSLDLSTQMGPLSALFTSNYQTTTGYKENDDNQNFNFMTTISYKFNPNFRFDLLTGYGWKRGGFFIYWKDVYHPYNNGSDPIGYQTRSTYKNTFFFPSINYVFNNRLFLTVKGKLNRYSSKDLLQRKTDEVPEYEETFRSSNVETHGGEIQINWQINSNGIYVLGADLQNDKVESIQFDSCRVSRSSFYMQYEQKLLNKIQATIGLRYDYESIHMSEYNPNPIEIKSKGDLSRKLGLNLSLTPSTNIRLSFGEGFRVPAIGERFVSTTTSGIRINPNPNLNPERSISLETGIRQSFINSMIFDMAIFYNKYRDLIEPQLDSDSEEEISIRFKNIVQARVQGIDCSFQTDWRSKMVSTQIGYTYIDSKNLSPGLEYGFPLKYRSKHTLYFTNDIQFNSFTIGMDIRYLSQFERIDEYHKVYIKDIDRIVPTYVMAIRFGFNSEHIAFRLLIDNLFQYNYLISPANIGPPRTLIFQLNINY
jgi:iron complex outermembrane receptor protein